MSGLSTNKQRHRQLLRPHSSLHGSGMCHQGLETENDDSVKNFEEESLYSEELQHCDDLSQKLVSLMPVRLHQNQDVNC